MKREYFIRAGLLTGSTALVLITLEIALRLTGFSFQFYPERIRFGFSDAAFLESNFRPDKLLLWTPVDYEETLQSLGDSPPAIVFLGDSCTQLGLYPGFLIDTLDGLTDGHGVRYANLGVAGWSSFQGVQQFLRDALPLRPAVVTVYFGWNDHWRGFKIEDKRAVDLKESVLWKFRRIRVIQMGFRAYLELFGERSGFLVRVRPEDFRRNLVTLVRSARNEGIVPILLTAPTSHTVGDEPTYLKGRWLKDLDDLVPLHQEYVDIVRSVAAEESVILCDLEARFAALPQERRKKNYFQQDGIHPTRRGDRLIAAELLACLEEHSLLEPILNHHRGSSVSAHD